MSSLSLLRVKKDIAEFNADQLPGIFIAPEESDLTKINALMVGPQDTPYAGGFFRLHITCPNNYPMNPPSVQFLTTDGNQVRFHPHIFSDGRICLSILGTWSGPAWTPALSLGSLLISIQSLLNDNPLADEPGKIDDDAASGYKTFLLHETIRVAVCDAVEDCLQDNSSFPPPFREVVLKKFVEFFDYYEESVKANLHLTGTMKDDLFFRKRSTYKFDTLLTRLRDLKKRVDKKKETGVSTSTTATRLT